MIRKPPPLPTKSSKSGASQAFQLLTVQRPQHASLPPLQPKNNAATDAPANPRALGMPRWPCCIRHDCYPKGSNCSYALTGPSSPPQEPPGAHKPITAEIAPTAWCRPSDAAAQAAPTQPDQLPHMPAIHKPTCQLKCHCVVASLCTGQSCTRPLAT